MFLKKVKNKLLFLLRPQKRSPAEVVKSFLYFLSLVFEKSLPAGLKEISFYVSRIGARRQEPKTKFVIFTAGRTGSELLLSLLKCHPEIRVEAEEILDGCLIFPNLFVREHSLASPKEVYGFKLKDDPFFRVPLLYSPDALLARLGRSGWKIITLFRDNPVRLLFSYLFADHRKIYHIKKGAVPPAVNKMYLPPPRALRLLASYKSYLATYETLLKGAPHLRLTYERDLLSGDAHQKTADRAFSFLGLSSVPVQTDFIRTTPDNPRDFIENHDELFQALSDSEFATYLQD